MLAQTARNAGFKPLVIDLFGDLDTRVYAEHCLRIASLVKVDLQSAVEWLLANYVVEFAVYGSGFEQNIDSLAYLSEQMLVIGNQSEVFSRVQNKSAFFTLLQTLQIPHPEVAFGKPENATDWLIKPMRGQGGIGISRYSESDQITSDRYWQKYQQGEPHSVLFLADGKQCQIVGFNRQWSIALNAKDEFIFSGVLNDTDLTTEHKTQLALWSAQLVAELSLKGLNSLDFIYDGQNCYVLEINPRPPASMQLYEADLFYRHLKACKGVLLAADLTQLGVTGLQIIYAKCNLQIPHGFPWPEGTYDIPEAGSIIGAEQPICSMIAHQQDSASVMMLLTRQQEFITYQLDRV